MSICDLPGLKRSEDFPRIRLVVEGTCGTPYKGPQEIIVPLPLCSVCHSSPFKTTTKRPFTFASRPFPFDLSDYPATSAEWAKLTSEVYAWLGDTLKGCTSDEWRWAVNFFWICYVGCSQDCATMNINWEPDFLPLAGEFMNSRVMQFVSGHHAPKEKGAQRIARLVEWLNQREKWIIHGVDPEEFHRRVVAYEV